MSVNIAIKSRLTEFGYRYKRDIIQIEITKKTTKIINLHTIARQLRIEESVFEKEFVKRVKKKLGISTSGSLIFSGKRSVSEFETILQDLIENCVLCPVCRLPEWNSQSCDACGHTRQ